MQSIQVLIIFKSAVAFAAAVFLYYGMDVRRKTGTRDFVAPVWQAVTKIVSLALICAFCWVSFSIRQLSAGDWLSLSAIFAGTACVVAAKRALADGHTFSGQHLEQPRLVTHGIHGATNPLYFGVILCETGAALIMLHHVPLLMTQDYAYWLGALGAALIYVNGFYWIMAAKEARHLYLQASQTVDEEYEEFVFDCDLYVKEQLERIERGDRTLAAINRDDYALEGGNLIIRVDEETTTLRTFLYDEYYRLGHDSLARRLDTICEGMARPEVIRIFSAVDWEPIINGYLPAGDRSLLSGLEKRLSNPLTAEQAWALKEAIDRLQFVTIACNEYIEPKVFLFQPYLETVLQWLDYTTLVLRWPTNASDGWELFEIAYQDERLRKCLAVIAAGGYPGVWEYVSLQGKWRNEARMAFIERGYFPWEQVNLCRARQGFPRKMFRLFGPKDIPQYPSDEDHEAALPCPHCNCPPDRLTWFYYFDAGIGFIRGWLTICESCHLQIDYFDESGK